MNVNETMKAPQDLNMKKDKLKQSSGAVPISFEFDPKTILTHVLDTNEIDHVSKKYPHDVKDWVEGGTACALNDSMFWI
jgi:hypothetical protein